MISVKTKTILIFTAITITLVLIMARVSYVTVKDNYLEQSTAHIKTLCSYMAGSLDRNYLEFLSIKDSQAKNDYLAFLKEHVELSGVENAFLFNKELQLLAYTKESISATQLQLNRNEILTLSPGSTRASFPFSDREGHWYIWGFFRINDNFFLGIQESAARLDTLNDLAAIFWGIGLAGVLLTFLAGWFIAHNISEPVNKLVSFSRKIGKGDFKSQAPQKIYGEFKILRDTMEQMKQDLSRKNDEREQMLAQIAHEIRNPLGGIELLAGLVKEDLGEVHESAVHLSKILDEVQSLKNQLTTFLEYSRPLKVHMEKIDLARVTKEIEQNFKNKIEQKNIQLIAENNVQTLFFDNGHFKQVLNNLVKNSIEATESGGRVLLRSGRENGNVVISVCDNGQGILPENEKNIFVPFFTTKANGTGLGLAVSRKLCLENNAELVFENNQDKGCTFSVKIHNQVN
jgi:signal transduction histidine kinase